MLQQGFGLLEVMLSFLIMALLSNVLFNLLSTTKQNLLYAQKAQQAMFCVSDLVRHWPNTAVQCEAFTGTRERLAHAWRYQIAWHESTVEHVLVLELAK